MHKFSLFIYYIISSFFVFQLSLGSKGGFCARRMVKGKWMTLGDCGGVSATINEVKKQVRKSLGCGMSYFNFRNELHLDYVQYSGTLPLLTSFSACVWFQLASSTTNEQGSILSYCVPGAPFCNTILVWVENSMTMVVYLNDHQHRFSDVPSMDGRSHACIVLSSEDMLLHFYLNGTEQADAVSSNHSVPADGVLILGQDQDGSVDGTNPGAPQEDADRFYGTLEDFHIWRRALNPKEIRDLHAFGCTCPSDAIVTFSESNTIIHGEVVQNWEYPCHPNDS